MSAGKDENCSDASRRVVNDLQVDGNARCFSSRLDDPLKPCVSWCVRVCVYVRGCSRVVGRRAFGPRCVVSSHFSHLDTRTLNHSTPPYSRINCCG